MKKRRQNSRPENAGDPHVLDQAAALLVRAIAKAIKQLPEERRATPKAANRGVVSISPTRAPATREEAVKIAARLFVLGCACSDLSLPLKLAAAWLPLADVAAFADRVEEHVRALLALYDEYLAATPGALERCGGDRVDQTIELEFAGARKEIGRLAKIADGSAVLDIGEHYLPPEFRRRDEDEEVDPGETEL